MQLKDARLAECVQQLKIGDDHGREGSKYGIDEYLEIKCLCLCF